MTPPVPPIGSSPRKLVCIHGYSDSANAFDVWKQRLAASMPPVEDVYIGSYLSLTNDVTIKDIARAMNLALVAHGIPEDAEFDAIVHSTGMLVIRSWLVTYPKQKERLRHLIGLAPATNGSPLAHKGRSVLASIFKGSKELGPDFLAVGDEILDALELGSSFTWDLAMRDLFGDVNYYGRGGKTPFVFIFCGNQPYTGLRKLVNEPGTDGTVRWSGCSLNSRRVAVDLTLKPGPGRAEIGDWHKVSDVPLIFCEGLNHATITENPPNWLVDLVVSALGVDDDAGLEAWCDVAVARSQSAIPDEQWQQFIIRASDERGDPVADYSITVHARRKDADESELMQDFETDIHAYRRDSSFRNFHVSLTKLLGATKDDPMHNDLETLGIEFSASTGSRWVSYQGESDASAPGSVAAPAEVWIDLTPLLSGKDGTGSSFSFFYPFTTTFVDLRVNRVPDRGLYTFPGAAT